MNIIAARPYLIYEMDWTKASRVLPEDKDPCCIHIRWEITSGTRFLFENIVSVSGKDSFSFFKSVLV